MKRIIALALVLCTIVVLASCTANKEQTDSEYVKDKGTLVVGITDFAPMDYQEAGSEEWIGFDADMAAAFAEKLGVKVEFTLIDWDSKVLELDGKKIDCVWNGMTLTDDMKTAMNCSKPYCNNAQVVVVAADKADKYQTAEACKELKFAVEDGSAGEEVAEANAFEYTAVADQATALMEVAGGTSDAAIIDLLMAGAMIGEGTSYADLTYTVELNSEQYGVGFRKGSDLTEMLNEFFKTSYEDGTMKTIAEKYGTQESIIEQ